MATRPFTFDADAALVEAFDALPDDRRRKVEVLLRLRLQDLLAEAPRPLTAVMDEAWRKAAANGMTAEEWEAALHEPVAPGGD